MRYKKQCVESTKIKAELKLCNKTRKAQLQISDSTIAKDDITTQKRIKNEREL